MESILECSMPDHMIDERKIKIVAEMITAFKKLSTNSATMTHTKTVIGLVAYSQKE